MREIIPLGWVRAINWPIGRSLSCKESQWQCKRSGYSREPRSPNLSSVLKLALCSHLPRPCKWYNLIIWYPFSPASLSPHLFAPRVLLVRKYHHSCCLFLDTKTIFQSGSEGAVWGLGWNFWRGLHSSCNHAMRSRFVTTSDARHVKHDSWNSDLIKTKCSWATYVLSSLSKSTIHNLLLSWPSCWH